MKQKLYEVLTDGTINEVCVYVNDEKPRYNLQTFLMEKLHNSHNWWDRSVREKVDKLIRKRKTLSDTRMPKEWSITSSSCP